MISFLIPVSRESYKTSLESILYQKINFDYEIIICFNDLELYKKFDKGFLNKNLIYFYNEDEWFLSYYKLFKKASKKYVYFLEDDDILLTNFDFFDINNQKNLDYYFGLYKYHKKMENNINWIEEYIKLKNLKIHYNLFNFFDTPEKFWYFQLSQILIKKSIIKYFPKTSNKYNDYYLFKNNPGSIKFINKFFFKQGWDGNNYSLKV